MTGAMVNRNLLNARDAYRKKKGLLTSREIKMIRMENGLSQKEFAEMLGLDQEAIVRYENEKDVHLSSEHLLITIIARRLV